MQLLLSLLLSLHLSTILKLLRRALSRRKRQFNHSKPGVQSVKPFAHKTILHGLTSSGFFASPIERGEIWYVCLSIRMYIPPLGSWHALMPFWQTLRTLWQSLRTLWQALRTLW